MRRFNLVHDPWIPVFEKGLSNSSKVSLLEVFDDTREFLYLSGNAVQKMSIFKLLLAIAQAAATPADDAEWSEMGVSGLAKKCTVYLNQKEDLFWLYDEEKPFLQFPRLRELMRKSKDYTPISKGRKYLPDISAENDSIIFDIQIDRDFTDAERAVYLISLMNYALGGKRTMRFENDRETALPGPSIGKNSGLLNTFLLTQSLLSTIYINMWTQKKIDEGWWIKKTIYPPWEYMPQDRDDTNSEQIKESIMGNLCGLSRFVLFDEEGMIYREGIRYPGVKEGYQEPFFVQKETKKGIAWAFVDVSKKPWRDLSALLRQPMIGQSSELRSIQIELFWNRARQSKDVVFLGVWAGGLQVRSNSGDQSVKQDDDFVESHVVFDKSFLGDQLYFVINECLTAFEKIAQILKDSISGYFEDCSLKKMKNKFKMKDKFNAALFQFWELAEPLFHELIARLQNRGGEDVVQVQTDIIKKCAQFALFLYDAACPSTTARQLEAWANHRPKLTKYFKKREEDSGEKQRAG